MDLQIDNRQLPEVVTDNIYPTLLRRIQSIFIDSIIILTTMVLITSLISFFEGTPDWIRGILFFMLFGIYEPVLIVIGGTIGNRLMSIKVRQNNNYLKMINIFQSYSRFIIKFVFGWLSTFYLSLLQEPTV